MENIRYTSHTTKTAAQVYSNMKENPLTYLLNIETESRLERSCLVGSAGCFKIVFVNTIPILMVMVMRVGSMDLVVLAALVGSGQV